MGQILTLLVIAVLPLAEAAEGPTQRPPETMGFDAGKVRPADPAKGEPVARVFYDYIYPADLDAAAVKLTEKQAGHLTGRIFGELQQRYIDRHKIVATPEEIQAFVVAMRRHSGVAGEAGEEDAQEDERGYRAIGEQLVKRWKIDRALYKQYGGAVIFQQANPYEPVGAYRRFLEELEAAKVFEIYQPDNRQKFWHYFVRQHPFQVPAGRVNFDTPWWLQNN